MIEKVNPSHPDKVADRIAGAIVDLAYKKNERPKIAVEVLIGHGNCYIITETSEKIDRKDIESIVERINGSKLKVSYVEVPQDEHLAKNQADEMVKCGDNGIFKGVPTDYDEVLLSKVVRASYEKYPTDGKFIYDGEFNKFIACQSNVKSDDWLKWLSKSELLPKETQCVINPLGDWSGGVNVDTGATNRKLGSDMGRAVTGGGLHGKDLSKADVSVNIMCFILAQSLGKEVDAFCAIGDDEISFYCRDKVVNVQTTTSYADVVKHAKEYVDHIGGFEKLAEWGLV